MAHEKSYEQLQQILDDMEQTIRDDLVRGSILLEAHHIRDLTNTIGAFGSADDLCRLVERITKFAVAGAEFKLTPGQITRLTEMAYFNNPPVGRDFNTDTPEQRSEVLANYLETQVADWINQFIGEA
jgi:hypothetical protein